jgi:hypothetical protein
MIEANLDCPETNHPMYLRTFLLSAGMLLVASAQANTIHCDVCVYGGTSGGVTAAVQAARMGKSVVLVSDYGHLGGMSSSGLGETDIGDGRIFGGLSKQFYQRLYIHYNGGVLSSSTPVTTKFEPHVAEAVFDQMVAEAGVTVINGLIDLDGGVTMSGQRITALHLEDGTTVQAAMFIDACYEGDLMAQAGVTFTIGREANAQYGETGNGIRGATGGNQLPNGINPYVVPGDPSSGLLPGVNADMGGATGGADHRLQAYCYRMCLTNVVANRVTVAQPAGYDEADYELLFRAIEAGQTTGFWKTSAMPNGKTDSNNASGISCDFIGRNYSPLAPTHPDYWDWSTLNHAGRAALAAQHRDWQLGLIWTVQNHPQVPQSIRDAWGQWGLPADEFADNGHWPYNLYVREARRMISDYVMTEHNAEGSIVAEDSVGMGAYTLDSHNTQRFVSGNQVKNEGDIQKGVAEPYPISYRSIIPATGECENLLVPWCTSSSHIAFGSIRMEPVFMILGQSAATAACFAIDDGVAVQQVDYTKLSLQLDADAQVRYLVAPPPADPPEVWLFASDEAASEGNPADRAAITVGRTGSTAATLVLSLGVSGTATPGTDYPALPATVTLAVGKTAVSIPIQATVDSVAEADETISVSLTVPNGYQAGANTSAVVTLHDMPPGDGSLSHNTITKISGGTNFNISVYPGKAGYAGTGATYGSATGAFGDGTVEAYTFLKNVSTGNPGAITSYASGGPTITYHWNQVAGFAEWDRGDVWTTNDPGTNFSDGAAANYGGTVETISSGYLVNGTIDISGFSSGKVYILCGGYDTPFQVDLTMSGAGLAPFAAGSGSIDPLTDRNMYVIAFDFGNASGDYDTIAYSYTGSASNRSRFMGVIVDGAASGTTYASWKTVNGTTQALDQDHDGDGVCNGVEYFLGGGGNTTGFTALPGVANSAGTLSVTWTKAVDYSGDYGTHYVVQTSGTLEPASWIDEPKPGNVTVIGNDVKYTFPIGTENFGRLKVTGP